VLEETLLPCRAHLRRRPMRAVSRGWAAFEGFAGLSSGAKVAAAVCAVCGLAAAQVLSRAPKREGHDLFSSEKPAAVRREAVRTVEGERAKAEAAAGAAGAGQR